jgi:hypothetical protein
MKMSKRTKRKTKNSITWYVILPQDSIDITVRDILQREFDFEDIFGYTVAERFLLDNAFLFSVPQQGS